MADTRSRASGVRQNTACLICIFLRSLSVQASWNFSRMQNIGIIFSLIPFIKKSGGSREYRAGFLTRHLESFNTHPYLTGPIVGSVAKLEEGCGENDICIEAVKLKNAVMAPYAAIGDPFFGGSLRPLAAAIGVLVAMGEVIVAPLVFLIVYNVPHMWVRVKGFIEGYNDGRGAVSFLKALDLPNISKRIRWVSVVVLGVLVGGILSSQQGAYIGLGDIYAGLLMLVGIFICFFLISKGISPVVILYGVSTIFLVVTW